ncbi:MAG: Single-stranded-DNA-specific exonuclease RecJ (EC [uncultured Sulfurovum sp.]|uniref:Single-stranded-DNA-specific exonuclease RecJ n=1 Tax=uncultured Sulfurovum sp. TaxID=269237 RepID=A0A6S6UG01_9BACT|nr:MAG: Single-stranded-DNA-specific exonuclease RecJ (EC [uncultured Sulfurovum sp.]
MLYPKITPQEIEQKLQRRFLKDGHLSLANLPKPSAFKDMDRAVARIVKAIHTNEKIMLIGDYDVDGVTSTTLINMFFRDIGVELEWIIPNRFKDGYGLSANLIPRIEGFDLVFTVDNGIAAVEAARMCEEMGIDLIITDHHIVPAVIPKAYAIVDQKQADCSFPYEEVCGAQIAWYLIAALNKALNANVDIKSYLGLVSIAIIADMMPLQHINRAMVKAGLQLLNRSELPAVKAFMEKLDKVVLNAEDIGFQIAPVLNSAGRMDDAKWSVEFLLSTNIYDARVRLDRLKDFNENRKAIEQKITNEAIAQVDINNDVLVVVGDDWHEGVVGIVAARVGRRFEKPCIVLTKSETGELKGSGRSFHVCNLFKITTACRPLLNKFGGHEAAIGLSLDFENLKAFKEQIQKEYQAENYDEQLIDPDILGELSFSHIDFELVNKLKAFEPYGQGNPRVKFISSNVLIEDVSDMGKEKEHRRFTFSQNGITQQAVLFKTKEVFHVGQVVSVVYGVNENHFNNRVTLQLMVEKFL